MKPMIQSIKKEKTYKMKVKVALENTENRATEKLPKKPKAGGLYQQMSKREGRMMWIGQFVYQGHKFRTNPCLTKTEARDALQMLRVEVRQHSKMRVKERLTFTQFAGDFLEDCRIKNRNYRRHASCFAKLKP